MGDLFLIDWSFIDNVGDNPFQAMGFFLANGGWIFLVWAIGWGLSQVWLASRQAKFNAKKTFIVLAIDVPRMHEQTPLAVDNMFAYLSGAHSPNSWTEKWILGRTQDTFSVEIVSIEGHVQYLIRTTKTLRDLCEAAVYSQYPDAEITEVEDYAFKVPVKYPDEEWDAWGVEMIPVRPDIYPLKTYPFFEDKVSGEFKDPLSALLESFSRLGPGEQAWYQIVCTPVAHADFYKKAEAALKKLKGEKVEAKKNLIEKAIDVPIRATSIVAEQVLGTAPAAPPKKESTQPKILGMTQGEKDVLAGIENKASKIVFNCKIRFLYIAKKQVMVKSRAAQPFIGAIKQFNTNNMQSLKPETRRVGVNGTLWFFKTARNNGRKQRLIRAYRNRSNWAGTPNYHLCSEELASLWHFPHSMQVKAPQLKRTEAKRSEPPSNLPFA